MAGTFAGLLLYHDATPVGWCQVAPRPAFPRLFRTRGLDLDQDGDACVWSVVCIYIVRSARRRGAAAALLQAAVDCAARYGAAAVEGYPVIDPATGRSAQLSSGTISLFSRAGFEMVAPAGGRRVVMRRELSALSPC